MLLIDNSAWARLGSPGLGEARRVQVADWMREGVLATTLPFLLEAGYSARSGAAHGRLLADLGLLPRVELDAEIGRLTLAAQADLARRGHHRVAPADLIIAACAHSVAGGVLHYDHDYDRILAHTSLEFDAQWLAPAGSLA